MIVEPCEIADVLLIKPRQFRDNRGFFSEVYNKRAMSAAGIDMEFVQDNHSYSAHAGTIRGLHFQKPPFTQAKLVRVVRGRVLDYAVDLRHASPSYGRHVVHELSASNWAQLFIPNGFAHAFCTLEPDTEVVYKVTEFYAPEADAGVHWADPDLAIQWPITADKVVCSDKDAQLPKLRDLPQIF